MIRGVRSVGIYVKDPDRAKAFWTEKLGFELLQDMPMGDGPGAPRWIEVAPPDKSVILVLFTPPEQTDRIGTFSIVVFHADDVVKTYEELKAKGVVFKEEPRREFWGGWWSSFEDSDGNTYGLGSAR